MREVYDLINRYEEAGGKAVCLDDGCLLDGTIFLIDATGKLKQFIIKEIFLNEWSSGYKIKSYIKRNIPKKYDNQLNKLGYFRNNDYR